MSVYRGFGRWIVLGLMALGVAPAAVGADDEVRERIESVLAEQVPALQVRDVRPTEVDGLYEVRTDQDTLYMTGDGRHGFLGEVLRFDDEAGIVNLTEQGRSEDRREALASLDESDMIIFRPEGEVKAVLHVFTDIECGYCRQLHQGMDEMNEMGIQVNYLAFPRGGAGSSGYNKLVSAWCAEDPEQAMDRAKGGESIPERLDCDHPVDEHFQLGHQVGVSGTPASLLEDGRMLPGYRPPQALAQLLGLQ